MATDKGSRPIRSRLAAWNNPGVASDETTTQRRAERGRHDVYSGAWLAVKLGIEPRALDAQRRAGELLAVPDEDGTDFLYPVWQFDEDGRPIAAVARVVRAARDAGLRDEELVDLLQRRDGMTGGDRRLIDVLREGREDRLLDVIRTRPRA
jgi:hypothetical protein